MQQGELIESGSEVWEIVEYNPENEVLEIKVLRCSPHMSTYVDVNETYLLDRHQGWSMEIWEIPPEQMKRDSSQVLLRLWEDGPNIEITRE